jgi:hypothetical protein
MTESEIMWPALTNEHDREVYLVAFWHGVNAGKDLENKMRILETRWSVERDSTTVQRPSPKGYGGDEVDGQC